MRTGRYVFSNNMPNFKNLTCFKIDGNKSKKGKTWLNIWNNFLEKLSEGGEDTSMEVSVECTGEL